MKSRDVVLAVEFDEAAPPILQQVHAVRWSDDAARLLAAMREDLRASDRSRDGSRRGLPYASLRARLQFEHPSWLLMSSDLELDSTAGRVNAPFAFSGASVRPGVEINDAIEDWIQGPLHRVVDSSHGSRGLVTSLLKLGSAMLQWTKSEVQLFPWCAEHDGDVYALGASRIATLLEGSELFPGLGPVHRVVGGPDQRRVELATRPVFRFGGRFSLVCRLSVETLPGALRPIVHVRFSRRRYAANVPDERPSLDRELRGHVFPELPGVHQAYEFGLQYERDAGWRTDGAFEYLSRSLQMEASVKDRDVVSVTHAGRAEIGVLHVNGLTTQLDASKIDAGVPLSDQLAGFEALADVLRPHGLRAIQHARVVSPVTTAPAARLSVIKPALVLHRLLSAMPNALDSPEDIDKHIHAITKRRMSDWFGRKPIELQDAERSIAGLAGAAINSGELELPPGRENVYVLLDNPVHATWIKSVFELTFHGRVQPVLLPLPAQVHGPTRSLPGADQRPMDRLKLRHRSWQEYVSSGVVPPGSAVLIQAPEWWGREHDDPVNKVAARRSLSAALNAVVQYVLPPDPGRAADYFMRLEAAALDLVFGHSGRVARLNKPISQHFSHPAQAPRLIVGIGVVRKERDFSRGFSEVIAATVIDAATAHTTLMLAHQEAETVVTAQMPFEAGLSYIASRERLELPRTRDQRRALYQRFTADVLRQAAERDPNAIVLVESSNAARHWSSLRDTDLDGRPLQFDAHVSLPEAYKSLRLIRVRDQAPMIMQVFSRRISKASAETVQVPTSVQRLYQVDAAVPTFWSIAGPITRHKRGVSCYREMRLPTTARKQESLHAPDPGQHSTPTATEFSVMQCKDGDSPLVLASFAQQLRSGVPQARGDLWVKTPAPLFALRKLTEYMP